MCVFVFLCVWGGVSLPVPRVRCRSLPHTKLTPSQNKQKNNPKPYLDGKDAAGVQAVVDEVWRGYKEGWLSPLSGERER